MHIRTYLIVVHGQHESETTFMGDPLRVHLIQSTLKRTQDNVDIADVQQMVQYVTVCVTYVGKGE